MLTLLGALSHAVGRYCHAARYSRVELLAVALLGAVLMWAALAALHPDPTDVSPPSSWTSTEPPGGGAP